MNTYAAHVPISWLILSSSWHYEATQSMMVDTQPHKHILSLTYLVQSNLIGQNKPGDDALGQRWGSMVFSWKHGRQRDYLWKEINPSTYSKFHQPLHISLGYSWGMLCVVNTEREELVLLCPSATGRILSLYLSIAILSSVSTQLLNNLPLCIWALLISC